MAKRKRREQPPGVKIRLARDGVLRLTEAESGRPLVSVRWRPCGTVYVELGTGIEMDVMKATVSSPKRTRY